MADRWKDHKRRRPRGAASVDLQGTLGSLLRSTLEQVGVVKDVVERQARSSLEQLDTVMTDRRRREALAGLGQVVWEMARDGRLGELAEVPEIAALVAELDQLEVSQSAPAPDGMGSAGRSQEAAATLSPVSSADWRPPPAPTERSDEPRSGRGRRASVRVWRPSLDADPVPAAPAQEPPTTSAADDLAAAPEPAPCPEAAPRRRARARRRRDSSAGGGIAFVQDHIGDDDDDLSAYMHEDDVPPRE
ncbi:hypothetical protein [Haliangium sp.]|uniref:hypothetical protein n=1 Tax=Haliangium sp. TaxID=2663208 RepID=UPI003D0CFC21